MNFSYVKNSGQTRFFVNIKVKPVYVIVMNLWWKSTVLKDIMLPSMLLKWMQGQIRLENVVHLKKTLENQQFSLTEKNADT